MYFSIYCHILCIKKSINRVVIATLICLHEADGSVSALYHRGLYI